MTAAAGLSRGDFGRALGTRLFGWLQGPRPA